MATTSTLPREAGLRTRRWLHLVDAHAGTSADFPLLEAYAPASLDLAPEGTVHEAHAYEAYVLTDADLSGAEAEWSVNGEGAVGVTFQVAEDAGTGVPAAPDGDDPEARLRFWRIVPEEGGAWRPFALTYGFAHVELALGSGEVLATRDIACVCDRSDQEQAVSNMMEALLLGPDAEAMRWMLADSGAPAPRRALIARGSEPDASRSLATLLALAERVLQGFARNLGFLCSHAYRRTVKADVVVGLRQVRHVGRREVQWLVANPGELRAAGLGAPVRVNGAGYLPERMRTERPQTTRDVPENRAVLAFARLVAAALADACAEASSQVEGLRQIRERLLGLCGEDGLAPSIIIIDACLSREEPVMAQAQALLSRAREVTRALASAMPEVGRERWRLPRRTKPFQEIPAYAELHLLMRRWDEFGEFSMRRDNLVLHTWRMDKLYEYYVLYRLLATLHGMGFDLDRSHAAEPARCARYSLADRDYANEDQVATVYDLARADERLTLYYQPVLYADEREENGVRLHRTSAGGRRPYWTPDYLLVREAGGRRTTVVLDAKFRRPSDVIRYESVSVGAGISAQTESTLRECLRKYKLETAGSDGRGVDAVWLLCGRAGERSVWRLQASAWARTQGMCACDGVATLAPGADALDEVLRELGIAGDAGE